MSSQNNGSPYIPHYAYQASRPISQSEFENPRLYALSAPYEDGFFEDPKALAKAICVVNLSGEETSFVLQHPEEFNRLYGDQRFNEKESAGLTLPAGRASHWPVVTECYIVTFGEWIIGEDGKKYWETLLGRRLSELENSAIVVRDGRSPGQLVTTISTSMDQDNYFTVQNVSRHTIIGKVVRENTAYALPPDVIDMERRSRNADLGGKVIDEFKITPKSTLYYKPPPYEFVIRALLSCQPNSTGSVAGRGIVVAPVTNYVEETKAVASPGDTVICFADEDKNGGKFLIRYDTNSIKKVRSDICITNH